MNWRWLLWWRPGPERVGVTLDPSILDATDVKRRQMLALRELEVRQQLLGRRVTALEYKVGALTVTVRVEEPGKGDPDA